MSYRLHAFAIATAVALSLLVSPLPASAQRGGGAGAAQGAERVHVVRRLNTAYRFTPPVRTVDALRRTMSRANTQRDIGTLLQQAGLEKLQAEVIRNLTEGTVTRTSVEPGTSIPWMAERRRGRPLIMRPTQWAGRTAFQAHQFEIDDRVNTYTFIVPLDCGNLSLLRQEPSRIAAREREEAARAEAARAAAAKAEADRAAAAKAAADKAAADKAAADKAAADKAAADKAAADKAAADKAAADKAAADAAAQAEADRLAAENAALAVRPFIGVYFGKQQRQYDAVDPADLGIDTNPVRRYGDAQFGGKFGVALRLGDSKWSFNPAIGFAGNLEEGSRSAGLVDMPLVYNFAQGTHLGSGLSFYDFTHKDIRTFAWLGEAGFPIWKSEPKKHQLDFQIEWRQFFDRGSDPDTNYQFWGGLRYLFK
jgi:hypothetical protein